MKKLAMASTTGNTNSSSAAHMVLLNRPKALSVTQTEYQQES
jgi:hypothetical protein